MSRSSPGVHRVVAILNFIADHPGQSFSLTDLVRALRLSRATCHSLLTSLVEAGYLYRSNDKSYVLGPALISMGEIARTNFSPIQVAQPEMRAIADEYDGMCAACFLEGSNAVVRDRAAALSHVGKSTPRGTRYPLLAQFASVFFVWSSPREVKSWLDKLDPSPREDQVEAMFKGIDFIRGHGFGAAVTNKEWPASVSPLDRQANWDMMDDVMRPLFEIDPKDDYHIGYVQAPVFDARRNVVFVLALTGLKGARKGAEIQAIGKRVKEACDRISGFMSRIPEQAA